MTGLHLQRTEENVAEIDALARRVGARAPLEALLGDLNRRGRRTWAPGRAVHRAWTFDVADRRDLRWWPQGISTSADADVAGAVHGRRVVVVAWYAKQLPGDAGRQGSRVTFYDPDEACYRHVLLVEPTLVDGQAGFKPLRAHAGGIVWHGDYVHVAATGRGFHTCRLDDLLRLDDDPQLRRSAFGYRYLLPVRFTHRGVTEDGMERLRYSFLSLDRSTDEIVAGEYASNASGGSRRLFRYALDPATGLLTTDETGRSVPLSLTDGVGHMQGAAMAHGRWHITTSHGRLRLGSVWTGQPGDLRRHRWATPMGPEDLAYAPSEDLLWSVTEHPYARWIYAMRGSWFK